ncbi:hypothetical protein E4P29_03265 [Rhodococcus sp. 1R11]|uniref:pentapeptide repeat-containing protein n=1 Tax=Rhodococcus sp. 1R11 TaxID=2559614 RepID=UPI001072DD09|nr:pentapeptide repeat-containing protein [Rhodococcus sp. 1R11]TFI44798.1 hypothetical protein E4P29_03265 [Rhodococcus sp. 1R11]
MHLSAISTQLWAALSSDTTTTPIDSSITVTVSELKDLLDQSSGGWLTQPLATLIAGAGVLASGYLVYRTGKHTRTQEREHFETSYALEVVRGLRDRFTTIASQLSDPSAAVRTAGIYAMEALAEDWLRRPTPAVTEAQACINVLCSYLRTPYVPQQGAGNQTGTIVRFTLSDRVVEERYSYRQDDLAVRQSIVRVLAAHLQPIEDDDRLPRSWSELDFDFSGAYFLDCDFSGAIFRKPVTFERAHFHGSSTRFSNSKFDANTVFSDAEFHSGRTNFESAIFGDGSGSVRTEFLRTKFLGVETNFDNTTFTGTSVEFGYCKFLGNVATFISTRFRTKFTKFTDIEFSSENTWFTEATFDGEENASFHKSIFSGQSTDFARARFQCKVLSFKGTFFTGEDVSFHGVDFTGERTYFSNAEFRTGQTSFNEALFDRGLTSFHNTLFASSYQTSFNQTEFVGKQIGFANARFESQTTFENPQVFANVDFDWTRNTDKTQPITVLPRQWPPQAGPPGR